MLLALPYMAKHLIIIGIVIVCAFIINYLLRRILSVFVNINAEKLKVSPTNYSFLKHATTLIVFALATFFIFYTIPSFRQLGTTLFAGAGIFAAILGFASQEAFSNIVAGIFIVVFKPFRVDDIIEMESGRMGVVEDITLRHTIIRDFQNQRIVVPNSIISSQFIVNRNIKEDRTCQHVEFAISYDSDIDHAMSIIRDEAINHPEYIDARTPEEIEKGEDAVRVKVVSLADFSVNIRAWVWADDPRNAFLLRCDLFKSVKQRFDKEGIEIPFPYRTIVYKNDLKKIEQEEKI